MAEEIQTESNNLIPDSILEEIEKVSKMEKDLNFLQRRQGSVEQSMENLRNSIADKSNVISEGEEEPKENKDLVKTEKLKPILDSIEKKRYENIGIEFVKGADKVFNELKKAEELKKKMSSKKMEAAKVKIEKKEDDNKKKKGGLLSLFLKLGLAIGAVVLVLEVFKDKINEIIPGFSYNYDNFKEAIRGVGEKVSDSISDFLQNTIGTHIKNTFEGDGGVNGMLRTFMTISLPNVILAASLELVKAFGGRVSNESATMNSRLQTATAQGLAEGRTQENEVEARLNRGMANQAVLSNPFSTGREVRQATSQMAMDSINKIDANLVEILGRLISNDGDTSKSHTSYVTDAYASSFVNTLIQSGMLNDGKVDDEELRQIYTQLGITEDFNVWRQREHVTMMFSESGVQNLTRVTEEFNRRLSLYNNRGDIERLTSQLRKSPQSNVFRYDGSPTVKLKITPEQIGTEIAQDAFAGELQTVFQLLKTAFAGDQNLGDKLLKEATNVVKYVYEKFLTPIFTIIKTAFPEINLPQNQQNGGSTTPPQSISSSGIARSSSTINVTNNSNAPVVVVDLSLDPTTVGAALEIAKVKQDLISSVKESNAKLRELKNIQVNITKRHQQANEEENQDPYGYNRTLTEHSVAIEFNQKRIENIENYLEANDRDEGEKGKDDFVVLQSQ